MDPASEDVINGGTYEYSAPQYVDFLSADNNDNADEWFEGKSDDEGGVSLSMLESLEANGPEEGFEERIQLIEAALVVEPTQAPAAPAVATATVLTPQVETGVVCSTKLDMPCPTTAAAPTKEETLPTSARQKPITGSTRLLPKTNVQAKVPDLNKPSRAAQRVQAAAKKPLSAPAIDGLHTSTAPPKAERNIFRPKLLKASVEVTQPVEFHFRTDSRIRQSKKGQVENLRPAPASLVEHGRPKSVPSLNQQAGFKKPTVPKPPRAFSSIAIGSARLTRVPPTNLAKLPPTKTPSSRPPSVMKSQRTITAQGAAKKHPTPSALLWPRSDGARITSTATSMKVTRPAFSVGTRSTSAQPTIRRYDPGTSTRGKGLCGVPVRQDAPSTLPRPFHVEARPKPTEIKRQDAPLKDATGKSRVKPARPLSEVCSNIARQPPQTRPFVPADGVTGKGRGNGDALKRSDHDLTAAGQHRPTAVRHPQLPLPRVITSQPFVVKPSVCPLTEPQTPNFQTYRRIGRPKPHPDGRH